MQTVRTTLLFLICVTLLGACGLKGPLYLPEEKATTEQTPDKDAEMEKDKDKDKEKEQKNGAGMQPLSAR